MKLTDKEAESVVKSINQSLENGKDQRNDVGRKNEEYVCIMRIHIIQENEEVMKITIMVTLYKKADI